MAFRDELHAAHTRAKQLEDENKRLQADLHAAFEGRFRWKSNVGRSVALLLATLFGLVTLGSIVATVVLRAPSAASTTEAPAATVVSAPSSEDFHPADPSEVRLGILGIEDEVVGHGPEAKSGDLLVVHYVGTFAKGADYAFDESRKRGEPFRFTLGKGQVIKGWEEGLVGMRAGGRRMLTIPPALAYGLKGVAPTIPPNATLYFDVKLLAINPP